MIGKKLPKFSLALTGSNVSHINPAKENFKNLNNRANLCEFGLNSVSEPGLEIRIRSKTNSKKLNSSELTSHFYLNFDFGFTNFLENKAKLVKNLWHVVKNSNVC